MRREKLSRLCWFIIAISVILMFVIYLSFNTHVHRDAIITISYSILSSFMSASFVILLFDVILESETNNERISAIENSVEASVFKAFGIRNFGINAAYADFNKEVFLESAKRSKKIFILQTYAPNLAEIRTAILDVLDRGGEVNLAVLNPDSKFVDIRASETPIVHKSSDDFRTEINNSCIARFESYVRDRNAGTASVALYDRSPGICIYGTDELMLISPYLSNLDAIAAPQIEISSKSDAYKIFIEHYQLIWDGSIVKQL